VKKAKQEMSTLKSKIIIANLRKPAMIAAHPFSVAVATAALLLRSPLYLPHQ
jgi:hypothetical protein